ncbi:CheR family methyltransferase [Lacibacterium aquatile]|uniref:CheR family methyltransferase n=1 Tax=Lacibacterium aquatile TaxID=1168082 RepID=A0ABW5DN82_9PROT
MADLGDRLGADSWSIPGEEHAKGIRKTLLHGLMQDVERIAGIKVATPVENKLQRIFAKVDVGTLDQWVRHLRSSPSDNPDWLSLIESLTVHETYFYRDMPQLDLVRNVVLSRLISQAIERDTKTLRIWSAACSTGEEAYTLAILAFQAMEAAGVAYEEAGQAFKLAPGWSLKVTGTDISRLVLRQAEGAVYETGPMSSFRDMPDATMRFFPKYRLAPGSLRVREDIRKVVKFTPYNLLSPVAMSGIYDLIACRNVLIYMAKSARHAILESLTGVLRDDGGLILGPTDQLHLGVVKRFSPPLDGASPVFFKSGATT